MQQKYKIRNRDTRKGKVFVVRHLHQMTIENANGSSINIAGINSNQSCTSSKNKIKPV